MHRTWGAAALLLAIVGLGCTGKPKRQLRVPTEQSYLTPPAEDKRWDRPPEYPEEKRMTVNPQKNSSGPPMPVGGGGGGGGPSGIGNPGGGMGGAGGAPGGGMGGRY